MKTTLLALSVLLTLSGVACQSTHQERKLNASVTTWLWSVQIQYQENITTVKE